jgi:UDP-N-acetylglucosamine/UDP-N-acetylgalactosamine diphosphorylase
MSARPLPPPEPAADLPARVRAAGQGHVLRFLDTLDGASRDAFLRQLAALDWDGLAELRRLARGIAAGAERPGLAPDLAVAETPACETLGGPHAAAATEAGTRALAAGEWGAILVAGGQGSRLGCTGPKGIVPVGPLSGRTLFEILAGKLAGIARRHGRPVPLAIMTSSATDDDTRRWLADHAHAGLDPAHVLVFRQSDLPALDDREANLLLDAPGRIAMAPDGHGGMLPALERAGGLEWFARRGCRHVVSFQVDNPLAMPLHPEFLGHHLLAGAEFTTQVVAKREPGERVGVVVRAGGRTFVVEYSDLPAALAAERRADGRLRFHAGSIAVHAFALDFLARAALEPDPLPLHLAHKAVPFLDEAGTPVAPRAPNAVKFERFIFDLMPLARGVVLVEIDPADGFAPLKNPPGAAADTLAHVHAAMDAFARRLLGRAGVTVAEGVTVEVAPWVLDAADVAAVCPPGTHLAAPTVVGEASVGPAGG